MRHLLAALTLAFCIAKAPLAPADDPPAGPVLAVANGQQIAPDALIDALGQADVVIAGEAHDNRIHHRIQAWLIRRLAPKAVAFEMVQQSDEAKIAAHLSAGRAPAEIGQTIGWEASGWPDWAIYRPVFEAAAAGDGAILGGGLPRDMVMNAVRQGAAAVAPPDLAPLVSVALRDDWQRALEAEMVAAHCDKLPAAMAPGMVEAQRLRDAAFAHAVLRAAALGRPAVLITGNGHARTDWGVPLYLAQAQPELGVLSIGLVEVTPGETPAADEIRAMPYDYVWLTDPEPREDPCKAFE